MPCLEGCNKQHVEPTRGGRLVPPVPPSNPSEVVLEYMCNFGQSVSPKRSGCHCLSRASISNTLNNYHTRGLVLPPNPITLGCFFQVVLVQSSSRVPMAPMISSCPSPRVRRPRGSRFPAASCKLVTFR